MRFQLSPPYRYDGQGLAVVSSEIGMSVDLRGVSVVRSGCAILENVTISIAASSFGAAGAERDGEERPAELFLARHRRRQLGELSLMMVWL